ncbi:MAG: hypothetical protein NVSMB28_21250 [Collimonas sp.]
MLPEWIFESLKNSGGAGAIIAVLMAVIVTLSEVIRRMYNTANEVYGYRLAERDVLNKALTDNSAVLAALNRAIEQRNNISDELTDAIKIQTLAFERLNDRIDLQNKAVNDEIARNSNAQVTAAQVYAKTVDDIRQYLLRNPERHR